MSRTPLIVANWKMNTDLETALMLTAASIELISDNPLGFELVLCPPFPWIVPIANTIKGSPLTIGAQDCSPESDGAFTGDVSAAMLMPWCTYILVGHSERRSIHGERDELVGRKLSAILTHGMHPILCVGETLDQRNEGRTGTVIRQQIATALAGMDESAITRCVVAYEPVWAIGTGQAASAEDAQKVAHQIRIQLAEQGPTTANAVRILYGGSVNGTNIASLTRGEDIDGALVGSASLDPDGFTRLCTAFSFATRETDVT